MAKSDTHSASDPLAFRFVELLLPGIVIAEGATNSDVAKILYGRAATLVETVTLNPVTIEAVERTNQTVKAIIKFTEVNPRAILDLIAFSPGVYSTHTHSVNVTVFALGLAQRLKDFDKDDIVAIGIGALLHDVGKADCGSEILRKLNPETEAEKSAIKHHPIHGYNRLKGLACTPQIAKDIVRNHHERLDGSGYPDRLQGSDFPVYSQVVALCDAYDSLTAERYSHASKKPYAAFQSILESMKDQFDREHVRQLIMLLNLQRN